MNVCNSTKEKASIYAVAARHMLFLSIRVETMHKTAVVINKPYYSERLMCMYMLVRCGVLRTLFAVFYSACMLSTNSISANANPRCSSAMTPQTTTNEQTREYSVNVCGV
jgi:hypothetical protein